MEKVHIHLERHLWSQERNPPREETEKNNQAFLQPEHLTHKIDAWHRHVRFILMPRISRRPEMYLSTNFDHLNIYTYSQKDYTANSINMFKNTKSQGGLTIMSKPTTLVQQRNSHDTVTCVEYIIVDTIVNSNGNNNRFKGESG